MKMQLWFLGDNIYPKGMPTEKGSKERKLAEEKITFQLEIAKNFKGKLFSLQEITIGTTELKVWKHSQNS